jgi:hypothetical protein
MERDIVERLREIAGPIVPNVCTDAAEAIERLRELLQNSYEFTKTLTAERDEARRYVCNLVSWDDQAENFAGTPHEYARRRGWDCFKEDGK